MPSDEDNAQTVGDRDSDRLANERALTTDIVRAQDEQRRRLATDLHDDAVQVMAAVALRIGLLRRTLSDTAQIEACLELEGIVAEATRRLRGLIADLHPAELDELGLAAAIRSALSRLGESHDVECTFDCMLASDPVGECRTTVFRIFDAALANAGRDRRASRVDVAVRDHDGGFLVRVHDDGVRIDATAIGGSHPGIAAMRARAELAGGWLQVATGNHGTTVEYWVPANSGG